MLPGPTKFRVVLCSDDRLMRQRAENNHVRAMPVCSDTRPIIELMNWLIQSARRGGR